jgi:anti-anti-sigma factor
MVASIKPVEVDPAVVRVVGRPTPTGPILVRVRHDLDLATVPAARAEPAALLADRTTHPSVLLDLGAERFVDMRGLRLLVETARQVRRRGGDLTVVAAPQCLRSMVARLDLGDELPLLGRTGT